MSAARWGLSPLDWKAHLVDPAARHPRGAWMARCGHLLAVATTLSRVAPGHRCEQCLR